MLVSRCVRRGSDMVRRGSVMVRHGSVVVRRGSVMVRRGSAMVQRGSVGSASACCKAGPGGEVYHTELTSDERRMNVLYECD